MKYKFKKQNCNVCGKDDAVFIGKRDSLAYRLAEENVCRIVRCKHCGLIYPDPMPFPDNEQLQINYSLPEKYFPEVISDKRFRFYETILNRISRYLKGKVKFLDIGCGRGELVYLAKKRGWQAYGIDISESFVDYAKKRFGLESEVKVSQLQDLDFPDEEFDAVSIVAVLQHTYDPKELLRRVNRILKKGGILFIEAMNSDGLVYRIGNLYYKLLGTDKTTHISPTFPSFEIYGFSPKSMKLVCDLTGFDIAKLVVLGGKGRISEYSNRPVKEKIIRALRDLLMMIAKWTNQGQVLNVYARKKEAGR